jgi:hypothetical protein
MQNFYYCIDWRIGTEGGNIVSLKGLHLSEGSYVIKPGAGGFANCISLAGTVFALALGSCGSAIGADTVQVNVKSILNARAVTTYSNGKFYTWTRGVDNNGYGDGYLTMAAAKAKGNDTSHALPNQGIFAATPSHPYIALNYNNADSADFQTHYVSGIDSFTFSVPQGNYSALFLVVTSSEGASAVTLTLTYVGSVETRHDSVPDYYNDISTTDTNFCYVAHDLAKWGNQNNQVEANHHNIDGLNIHPNVSKPLTSVKLVKNTSGSYMAFWGAIAVGTSTTAVEAPAIESRRITAYTIRSANGLARIANVKPGTSLVFYSPAGERAARFRCPSGGSITVGAGNGAAVIIPPGVFICELRLGRENQRLPVMIAR